MLLLSRPRNGRVRFEGAVNVPQPTHAGKSVFVCQGCPGSVEPDAMRDLSCYWSAKEIGNAREHAHRPDRIDPGKCLRKTLPLQSIRRYNADTTRIQRGYNYTIRDLTGVEIEPTKTFPANAAGKSGFENSDASAVFNERLCGLLY